MSNKALYRKYRPTTLQDVVGQPQVTNTLQNALDQGKVSHAYLFIGPRGTGKTSVARIFAHAVNQFTYQAEDSYLDIIEIDAASNTGVDNIRELREKAIIAPSTGKYKVYIIDEVHMLTKSASNALLKTLEEPPEHVIFIMATTDAHKVPITISSRTQVFTFKLADADTMFSHLRHVADQEHIQVTDDALKLIVHHGGGSYRDSMSLLDQAATLQTTEITAESLANALGLPQDQSIQTLLSAYAASDTHLIRQTLKEFLNSGIKPETIASELLSQIIHDPRPEWLELLAQLPNVQPPFPEAKLLLALLARTQPAPAQPTHNIASPATTQTAPAEAPSSSAPSIRDQLLARRKAAAKTARATATNEPANVQTTDTPETNATFAPISGGEFDWDAFLDTIKADNSAIHAQLQKSTYEFVDNILHIYPEHALTKSILDKPGNRQVLSRHLGGLSFELHEAGEKQPPKDETLSQISAIMGDVREIKDDSPF